MKRCIRYISALLAVLAFFACSDDDEPAFIPASFELISGEGTESISIRTVQRVP